MSIGVALPSGDTENTANIVDELIAQTRQAADAGLDRVWFSQRYDHDAIALAALAGRAVPEIAVGTSIVPIVPRHPLLLASLAQTAQAATGGRFTLGVGLGAKALSEAAYGVGYPPPIRHLREWLTVLNQALDGEQVSFDGETVSAHPVWPVTVQGSAKPEVIVAAMGLQALRVTGELADGTLPFLAGPRTVSRQIVPAITKAAEAAGRPAPKIIVAFPAIVTDEPDAVRELAAPQLAFYDDIPSYRKILDAEGVDGALDLAVIGDEKTVADAVRRYFDAGATEVVVTQAGLRSAAERLRTWALLGGLAS
ncbi:LLM class F420-dependent oxidoreductase [Amycolatopsis sp. H20-H5]|uniref:LLM class F420-dependent oxidoreductase n=1 Tax=Amycolatopsis sp. H20-H5 TaxID=3046309 RepID=UPI002DBD5B4D|nr:LLM class F420-dependent oxidoreductase [Amycolatopsis sp. H20-H5]MEC3977089.1 LLM class F420-dependent oxidoreductase [Amycolatopsis sp. H20-H5]